MQRFCNSRCVRNLLVIGLRVNKSLKTEHHHVASQKNLMICSAPPLVEPAQHGEFNANTVSVEDLDTFPNLEHLENIADLQSQSLSPPL